MVIEFGDPIDFEIPIADITSLPPPSKSLAGRAELKVFMLNSAHDQMINHILLDKNIECGGVLVGYPFQDRITGEAFVIIVGVIPDLSDNRSVIHFTVTPDAISRTRTILENEFPDLIAVGWYHSHPGHGVFLSGQDMTIVRGIYNESWNLAWVIDPQRKLEGIFYGSNGEAIVRNQSSHPIFQESKSWIPLFEYPQCIKDLQPDRAIYGESTSDIFFKSHQPKTETKMPVLRSRREEIEEIATNKKNPLTWVFFLIVFVSALLLTCMSVFAPNWTYLALFMSIITILAGIYILIDGNERGAFSSSELRTVIVLVFSLGFLWIVGFFASYIGVLRVENPIVSTNSETVGTPINYGISSVTPVVLSPTPFSTISVTSVPQTETDPVPEVH